MKSDAEIPSSVRELAAALSQPKPMRRGSVSVRHMKCGKPSCPCQKDPHARHGPYYSLTRPVGGKTQSRYLSPEQAGVAQKQVELGRRFQEQVERYREACERWADEQIGALPASAERAEKRGSQQTSKTKSSRKSKFS